MSYEIAVNIVGAYAVRRREEMGETTEGNETIKEIVTFIDLVKTSYRFEELQHAAQLEELTQLVLSSSVVTNFIRGGVSNLVLTLGRSSYDLLVSAMGESLTMATVSTIKTNTLPKLDLGGVNNLLVNNPWLVFCLLLRQSDLLLIAGLRDKQLKEE